MRKALLATKNGVEFIAIRTPQGKTLRYENLLGWTVYFQQSEWRILTGNF